MEAAIIIVGVSILISGFMISHAIFSVRDELINYWYGDQEEKDDNDQDY